MPTEFKEESVKLFIEHTKHLTTLSAGSIIAIVTLYEKISASHEWKLLIAVSLTSFIISILAGMFAQIGLISSHYHKKHYPVLWKIFIICWLSFASALAAICIYGIRNIYT